jgi:hypothetical protein
MYILLFLLITVLVLGIIAFIMIKSFAQRVSKQFFGTSSIQEGLELQRQELANTPKSVSSMTRIYLPIISKDFPELNLHEFTQRAENMLKSVFNAIENKDLSLIINASDDLRNQVAAYIEDLQSQAIEEHYDDVIIHQTEIYKYQKDFGTCVIVFQMAIEYYMYRIKDNEVVSGSKDLKLQTKYNVNLVYIQDVNKLTAPNVTRALGTNCPNCGAPITNLGQKKCDYCGSGIKEININTWLINKYEEI